MSHLSWWENSDIRLTAPWIQIDPMVGYVEFNDSDNFTQIAYNIVHYDFFLMKKVEGETDTYSGIPLNWDLGYLAL